MNKFTPPPLFNLMREKEADKLTYKPTLKYTPVSSNVAAGPIGIPSSHAKFTPTAFEGHAKGWRGCVFTPSGQGVRYNEKYDVNGRTFKLTWWEPKSIFHYDAMLMSSYYGMKWWNFRDYFNIPRRDFLLVADSGGFQQLTSGERIEPISVLRWQENNADIGFILDIPPLNPKTLGPAGDFSFFKKCALKTARNAEIMDKHREKEDFLLYSIVQGGSVKELEYWYGCLKDFSFDGICGSPKPPNDPMQVALHIAFAHSKGAKRAHILLGTGSAATPVNVYGSKLFDLFTFDSSSYATGSKLRKYELPYSDEAIYFSTLSGRKVKLERLPCDCPVCRLATPDDLAADGSVPGALISLHNLYNYLRKINLLSSLASDEEAYLDYVKRYYPASTVRAIEFLQRYRETDFHTAYSEYFRAGKNLASLLE